VTLREESGPKRPQRADELTLKGNVRVVIQPGASNSLLSLGAGARTPAEPGPAKLPEKGEIPPAKAELPRATAGSPSRAEDTVGQADRGTAGAEKREDPILITSAGPLTIYRGAFTALFRDDVRAVQGTLTITCDILTLVFRPAREDERTKKGGDETQYVLDTGTAVGKVRVDDTQTAARADMAFWKSKEAPAKPAEGTAKPPTDPKKDSNRFQEGAVKLIGQPAQVTWGNGDRLCGPVIYRLEGGSEFICSPSEESQGGVHLFTATTKSGLAEPPKKNEPSPKPTPPDR